MIDPSKDQGFLMIRNIAIRNFRGFKKLDLADCARVNIIVGDSGSGKTALLEALILALATSPATAVKLRQQRGLEMGFQGSYRVVDEALWGGFFHRWDMTAEASVELSGDGPEARSLRIYRGSGERVLPLTLDSHSDLERQPPRSMTFEWKDHKGEFHRVSPKISEGSLAFPETEEDLGDFFMFAATSYGSARESSEQFSQLSKKGEQNSFLKVFREEYPWVEDISVQTLGGLSVLHVKVAGLDRMIPITDVSAGLNRIIGILLAMASVPKGVVMVDEVENGIYYEHLLAHVNALLSFAVANECQLFLTTHSAEWLKAFVQASKGHKSLSASLWRIERTKGNTVVRQFSGKDLVNGLETGREVR